LFDGDEHYQLFIELVVDHVAETREEADRQMREATASP
jgi:hypothetical protein